MKYKITAEVDCEVSNVLKPWSLCSGFPARKSLYGHHVNAENKQFMGERERGTMV